LPKSGLKLEEPPQLPKPLSLALATNEGGSAGVTERFLRCGGTYAGLTGRADDALSADSAHELVLIVADIAQLNKNKTMLLDPRSMILSYTRDLSINLQSRNHDQLNRKTKKEINQINEL
jgi:hypothetical protein